MAKMVEDEVVVPPHRKSRKGVKKPYTIEWRLKPEVAAEWKSRGESHFPWAEDWSLWQRYATEKQRGEALKNLQRKSEDPNGVWPHHYEYRANYDG